MSSFVKVLTLVAILNSSLKRKRYDNPQSFLLSPRHEGLLVYFVCDRESNAIQMINEASWYVILLFFGGRCKYIKHSTLGNKPQASKLICHE